MNICWTTFLRPPVPLYIYIKPALASQLWRTCSYRRVVTTTAELHSAKGSHSYFLTCELSQELYWVASAQTTQPHTVLFKYWDFPLQWRTDHLHTFCFISDKRNKPFLDLIQCWRALQVLWKRYSVSLLFVWMFRQNSGDTFIPIAQISPPHGETLKQNCSAFSSSAQTYHSPRQDKPAAIKPIYYA